MNWPWFLKPLDARSSDICVGSIDVILALSCGFAEIFAAIGFIIGARAPGPEVDAVVLAEVLDVGVLVDGGVLVEGLGVGGAPGFGPVTCGCGAAEWPCCGSASAGAAASHVAAATPTMIRATRIRHPRKINEASGVPAELSLK
jgi:hypothetical protein